MVLRINNNSGMIMVIVTMMVIVMSVVMIGLLGRNFTFVLSSEEQLKRIEAEQVAKGAFWRAYQNMVGGSVVNTGDSYVETVDGRQYTVTYTVVPGSGPSGTNEIKVDISY